MHTEVFEGFSWTWQVQDAAPRADLALLQALEEGKGTWLVPSSKSPPPVTRSQLKRYMEEGRVRANGVLLKPNSRLKPGFLIRLDLPPPEPLDIIPEDRPLDILYEDQHLVVVNKPPSLTVHPSSTQKKGTLVHALVHHIQDLSGIGGVLRPGIVHRIDKDTSGALVITKTDAAHVKLAETFSKHQIKRVYWALCYGVPEGFSKGQSLKIESLIGRHPVDRKKMSMTVTQGRKAVSTFKKLASFGSGKKPFASWLEVTLETGRTHQVRVHLSGIGNSILGDPVYGTPTERQTKWLFLPEEVRTAVRALPGQALHARVLGFNHPITGKPLHFEAEPPESFQYVLNTLKKFERN